MGSCQHRISCTLEGITSNLKRTFESHKPIESIQRKPIKRSMNRNNTVKCVNVDKIRNIKPQQNLSSGLMYLWMNSYMTQNENAMNMFWVHNERYDTTFKSGLIVMVDCFGQGK
eukprot:693904_1